MTSEQKQQARLQIRDRYSSKGLCENCGQRPFTPNRLHCTHCRAKNTARAKRNYYARTGGRPYVGRKCSFCGVVGHTCAGCEKRILHDVSIGEAKP